MTTLRQLIAMATGCPPELEIVVEIVPTHPKACGNDTRTLPVEGISLFPDGQFTLTVRDEDWEPKKE
jgi:hypothetical protein